MVETIDQQLFLWLNGLHVGWLDTVMVSITQMWPWIPIYILLVFMVFKRYGKRGWWVVLAFVLVVVFTDQISASICKPLFHRLRPCFNPQLKDLVHLPNGLPGGQYGFVSSHAANTFGMATFLTLALRKQWRWIGWVLFFWALVSSYSRIYLGVHYPGDILCGAVLGVFVGWGVWRLLRLFFKDHLDGRSGFDTQK